jgi:hypothetical protein
MSSAERAEDDVGANRAGRRVSRFVSSVLAILIASTLMSTGAAAQEQEGEPTATVTVDPAEVDSPGSHELSVTGTDWGPPSPYFVVPCAVPDSGLAADVDTSTCDSGALVSATVDPDGELEADITVDIGPDGVVIVVVNGDQSQTAAQIVSVAASDGDDDGDGDLPDTGAGSDLVALTALLLVAAGAMMVQAARRD